MAKTIAQLAQEAYERSKRTGVSQTKSGGTVANPVAQQQQAAVKAAQQAASTGNYGTTSGGTVKGTAKPKAYTSGGGGVSQSERAAAYSTPKVTVPTITAPTISAPKQNPNTGAAPKYDAAAAVKAAMESAAKQQQSGRLITRYGGEVNYSPYLDDEDETGTTDVTSDVAGAYTMQSGKYQLPAWDRGINYDTIAMLMDKYGKTEADLRGLPLEALYTGDGKYVLPYLVTGPDSNMIMSNGNLISTGDFRQGLMDGLFLAGNEAALNDWYARVAQNPEVRQVDPYEYEEDYGDFGGGAYDDVENAQQSAFADYIRAAIEAITGQKAGIDESAAAAKQQAYANYMRSRLGMGESTAGMATGTADSLAVQNDLMLQNSLNAIDRDRLNAYADIDSQAAQMEAEGNLQLAQMAAEAQQRAEERARQEREWAYQLEQDRIKNATSKKSSGGSYSTESEQEKAVAITTDDVRDYLELQLGMGNNMTRDNILSVLSDMVNAGTITKTMAQQTAKTFGITASFS